MINHLVNFDNLKWIDAGSGIRYKRFEKDGQVIRLMELSDKYKDTDWCISGHISYILDGCFTVNFENHTERFTSGDTVFIPKGEKHIAMVEKENHLEMISFEL